MTTASKGYVQIDAATGVGRTDQLPPAGGSGTVTSVSVTTANGVSGSVATATTTPAISLTLGAITPTSVSTGNTTIGGNTIYTPLANNSLAGANQRIPSHPTSNIVFTNASLTSVASANNGGVVGGHTLCITNATGAAITIVNNYGSAAAGEAILTGVNGDLSLPNNTTIWFQYNATGSVWACVNSGLIPISSGVSGLGTNVATFLATPSSANLAAALTDETGTGSAVFGTSPTLVTPNLGTPSTLVGTNITGTAAGLTAGTVTTNANLTGHITSIGNAAVLGSFTSAQLATALTDETGSGAAVFGTSPTIAGGTHTGITSFGIKSTAAAFDMKIANVTPLTADRTLTIDIGDAARSVNFLGGIVTFNNSFTTGAAPITLTTTNTTTVTLPTTGTLYGTATGSITSLQLLTSLSDETGSGLNVFGTSPTLLTSVITSSATFAAFNTNATTVNAFGAATTLNIGGTPTTAVTHNYSANATATATTKTVNIGTAGASGSTTNINIGSAVAGSLGTITLSEATNISSPGSTTVGQLTFSGATTNWIDFGTTGSAAPSFTTRSAGTRLALYNSVAAGSVDFGFGIEGGAMWSSVGQSSNDFKWYGGTTLAMTLNGAGQLLLAGSIIGTATQNVFNTVSTTVNAFGAATTLNIGSTSGTTTINGNVILQTGRTSTFTGHNINVGSDASYDMWNRGTGAGLTRIANGTTGQVLRATTSSAQTWTALTRTGTTTSSATPTINTDNVEFYDLTAQAVDITSFTTNLSGTPVKGQKLWIAITGTAARAITWGASFEASTIALPTTTVTTARLDVGFIWNDITSKWRCVGAV